MSMKQIQSTLKRSIQRTKIILKNKNIKSQLQSKKNRMMNLRKYSKSRIDIKEKMKDKNNSIGDTTLSIVKTTKLYTLKS